MRRVVGIDRRIKRAWLDKVLDRVGQTNGEAELRAYLDRILKAELPGKASRAKSAGIVMRIWGCVPAGRVGLRDRAVALLAKVSGQERVWLHWGMTALAYPFFRDAAEIVGRLSALQDDFTTGQIQARLVTAWGDRATSNDAAQQLMTTLLDWEVLKPSKVKGQFLLAHRLTTESPELQLWLLEALLGANAAEEIEAQQLLRMPESFPFALSVGVADLRRHQGFSLHRQGLDTDMVALRKVRVEQAAREAKRPRGSGTPKATTNQPSLFAPQAVTATPFTLADSPFATPIAECTELVRGGRLYAGVALAQAILEAAVLLVWRVKVRKRRNQPENFLKALDALRKRSLIDESAKSALDLYWGDRTRILMRRPPQYGDSGLEATARRTVALLETVTIAFFAHSDQCGVVSPNHPEYWAAYVLEQKVLT